MKVCFIVRSLKISGGIYAVLQHALHMSRCGIDVTIATTDTFRGNLGWHPGLTHLRIRPLESIEQERFDLALATWWSTVYDLPRVIAAKYAYFVQQADYLIAPNHLRECAERTLRLGLNGITVSTKLSKELGERYGMTAHVALNGIDKEVFSIAGPTVSPRREGGLRVLVEGPLGSKTKGVPYAIRLARHARADEIWLLTSSEIGWYPGVDRVFSGLNAERCAAVYRSCDVLLKLSTIESCCLPILEMLHCGGTVVAYKIPGPDEYLTDGTNALLLSVGEQGRVVDALQSLRRDPNLVATLRAGAQVTADRWPTWELSSGTFHGHCLRVMAEPGPDREQLHRAAIAENRVLQTATPTLPAALLSAVGSIADRSQKLKQIKTVARALLLEQRVAPRSVMQPDGKHLRSGASLRWAPTNEERRNGEPQAAVPLEVPPCHKDPAPAAVAPLITIAIPTYNRAGLLKECVRSALAQTYPHFEVLVLNNASTDETSKVLGDIHDKRLRVITQNRNIGLIPNWNSCLTEARGKYVVFVSDDDHIAPHFLQRCVSLINLDSSLPIVIALSDIFLSVLHRNIAAIPNQKLPTGIWLGKRILLEFLRLRIHTNICTILFATRELQARGGFSSEFSCAADLAASLPLLLSGKAGFVNETCGSHSVHDRSATSRLDLDVRFADDQKVSKLIAKTLEYSISDLEERKLIILEGKRWAARNAIISIAAIRRQGAPFATTMHEVWSRRHHLYCLGIRDVFCLVKPLAIIALPSPVTACVARVKNAISGKSSAKNKIANRLLRSLNFF